MKEDTTIDAVAAQIAARWLRHRPAQNRFYPGQPKPGPVPIWVSRTRTYGPIATMPRFEGLHR
jgi:hypothetical protein